MKNIFLRIILFLFMTSTFAQAHKVEVVNNSDGMKLTVNGKGFMINGMNWDYVPIGTSYSYSLWKQSDDIIKAALDSEMSFLKNMGVNAIRVYVGIPPKWIQYIYKNYGIYTMLNHSFGRYGLTINSIEIPVTDYRDPATQEFLMGEITVMAKTYKDTPGLLLFLLGNENNYGLFWQGAETEDFPDDADLKRMQGETRGRPMYKLMNDAAIKIKSIDGSHPIAICNGDLLFVDIVADECKDVDIYGTNMYRGTSFGDAFEKVKKKLNKPILFTEFGSDAFNALTNQEDQKMQAFFLVENWKEIYENAAGLGKAENSIGGFTFQFSDGWWKLGQTKNLDVHDTGASWLNGGYYLDTQNGSNNMNEEWFGICAKGPTNKKGLYDLYPRAAYYALKEVHKLNPYEKSVDANFVRNHFDTIQLVDAVLRARGDKAALFAVNLGALLPCAKDETKTVTTYNTLVKADEFNTAGAPNPAMWNIDIGTGLDIGLEGWGNDELQYYTDRPENIVVKDGMLKITAHQESYKGSGYTSARIQTKNKFEKRYGRFEARIQLPWSQGLWPAFWMLGSNYYEVAWPACGEIDIMENKGQAPTHINGSVHGPGYSGDKAFTKPFELENDRFDTGFHVFGIEWGEGFINFYVDDVLYNQITPNDVKGEWVFDNQPFYIIMNVAVGGNYVGSPNKDSVFPQTMFVDYVRIYE
jgi:beta-glucanase (GH16 family)